MCQNRFSKHEKPELVWPRTTIRFFRDILCAVTKDERSFIRRIILQSRDATGLFSDKRPLLSLYKPSYITQNSYKTQRICPEIHK
jgi:hypothetical protein